MGVFLYTAIVQNGNIENIRAGIQKASKKYSYMNIIPEKCEFINSDKGVLVIFNERATVHETVAKVLSKEICLPVMLWFIYDSDGWGYFYCEDGVIKDLFSVWAEEAKYMESLLNASSQNTDTLLQNKDMLTEKYNNSAKFIAERFHININEIINYYIIWTDELIEDEEAAYEDDEFTYGDCWQVVDFMRKLGFLFPNGGDTKENVKSSGIDEQQELSKLKSPQAAVQNSKKAPEPKKFIQYGSSTPYVCAFDYSYEMILMKRYGSRLEDIIKIMELGKYRQARDELTKKIDNLKDNCNSDEEREFLSGLYLLRGNLSRTIGNSWQAGKDLDAAYALEPENIYILRQRVQLGTSKERIKRAINDLNTLMRIDEKNYDYYLVERAWRYYRIEEMEAARSDLREAKKRGNSGNNTDFVVLCEKLGV